MRRKQLLIIAAGTLSLLCVVSATFVFLAVRRRLAAYPPQVGPTVLLTSPTPGELAQPLSMAEVQAMVYGPEPVQRVELWLDGELVQTQENGEAGLSGPQQVGFTQGLIEGDHLFFVRAVDINGLVGQSLPLTARGALIAFGEGPYQLVVPQDGSGPVEALAAAGIEPASVFPGGSGSVSEQPAPGAELAVPLPGEDPGPAGVPAGPAGTLTEPTPLEIRELYPVGLPLAELIPARKLEPPAAPASLQITAEGCDLTLAWLDQSDQEAGFDIWVTGLGVPPQVVARMKAFDGTGAVQAAIQAPGSGSFVFWVEAFNIAGRQPGNQAGVDVAGYCANGAGDQLIVELLDFNGPAQVERVYCYVSVQDSPETRLPGGQDQFIPVSGGNGDLAAVPAAFRTYRVAVPSSGVLKLSGECWGWAGGTLTKLGGFDQGVAREAWDGGRIALPGSGFELGLSLKVITQPGDLVPFAAPDPGVAPPKIVALENAANLGDVGLDPSEALDYLERGNQRTLRWEWQPGGQEAGELTGFTILLNGIPFKQVNSPSARSAQFEVPGFCGTKLDVSMVANAGQRQSLPGNVVSDVQPECTLYAVFDFESVNFAWTNDTLNPNDHCSTMDTFFHISVKEVYDQGGSGVIQGASITKHFNGGGFYMPIRCGMYDLNQVAGSRYTDLERNPTQIVLPIRVVEGHTTTYIMDSVIWDYDELSDNDRIARFEAQTSFRPDMLPSLMEQMEGAPAAVRDYYCDGYVGSFNGDAKSKMELCLHIYATNPSSGAAGLPSNAPTGSSPPATPGPQAYQTTDLALLDTAIDANGELTVRVRNEGPGDLTGGTVLLETTIQSDDPRVGSSPWLTRRNGVSLKIGARTDIPIWPWDRLDPASYSYNVQVRLTAEGFSQSNTANDVVSTQFAASSALQLPEPLHTDVLIRSIAVDGKGGLRVRVGNDGPDYMRDLQAEVTCEGQAVSRSSGASSAIPALSATRQLNLDVGGSADLILVDPNFTANLFTHWYQISCQVHAAPVYDINQANDFLTMTLQ